MSTPPYYLVVSLSPVTVQGYLFAVERWPKLKEVVSVLSLPGQGFTLRRLYQKFTQQLGSPEAVLVVAEKSFSHDFLRLSPESFFQITPQVAWQKAGELFSADSQVQFLGAGREGLFWATGQFGRSWAQKGGQNLGSFCAEVVEQGAFWQRVRQIYPEKVSAWQNLFALKALYPHLVFEGQAGKRIQGLLFSYLLEQGLAARQLAGNYGYTRQLRRGLSQFVVSLEPDLELGAGGAGTGSEVLFALLNSKVLPPLGEVFWDEKGLAQALGAIFAYQPASFFNREKLCERYFTPLASALRLEHQEKEGTALGKMAVDLGLDELLQVELVSGELIRLPQQDFDQGQLEFDLKRSEYLPRSFREAQWQPTGLMGGKLGLIIDLRCFPLWEQQEEKELAAKFEKWREVLS